MSTTTPYGATLDVSQTPKVPLTRLIQVELRKMVDTRAGRWLLITMAAISALIVLIVGLAGQEGDKTFSGFMFATGFPQSYLLPILGILLVTQEWGQRTAMVTFSLEPHRSRVITAKVLAALVLGMASIAVALATAALATAVFGGSGGFDDFGGLDILKFAVFEFIKVSFGLVFGLLILNSAGAIVTSFLLPIAFSIVANVWSLLQDKARWIDLGSALEPLVDIGSPTGREWAQIAVTSLIWVGVPFAVGFWRVLRAEVK